MKTFLHVSSLYFLSHMRTISHEKEFTGIISVKYNSRVFLYFYCCNNYNYILSERDNLAMDCNQCAHCIMTVLADKQRKFYFSIVVH